MHLKPHLLREAFQDAPGLGQVPSSALMQTLCPFALQCTHLGAHLDVYLGYYVSDVCLPATLD